MLILWGGTGFEQLSNLIESFGLEKDITLLGFQKNPYPYIKNADLFLLSSRDEAFPLVVGESLIIGTPVIATDCAGVSEWIENGRYGLIIENSIDGIVDGMMRVLREPELLNTYRKEIPNAQSSISFRTTLEEFEKILYE